MIEDRKQVKNRSGLLLVLHILLTLPLSPVSAGAQECLPILHDVGDFRVGLELGRERAAFSGRPYVMIFTRPDDPHWPVIQECLMDLSLREEMKHFVGVLVDDLAEPELERVYRDQGFRVVIRSVGGAARGFLQAGFTCLELMQLLQVARDPIPRGIDGRYANLLEDPSFMQDIVSHDGCATAANTLLLFEEFEGKESPAALEARAILTELCETFIRGDTTGDGLIDISDPIRILGFLFLGQPRKMCSDAADSNDDGTVDLSDALYILRYLFLCANSPPRSPFPSRGADPTADDLGCEP